MVLPAKRGMNIRENSTPVLEENVEIFPYWLSQENPGKLKLLLIPIFSGKGGKFQGFVRQVSMPF